MRVYSVKRRRDHSDSDGIHSTDQAEPLAKRIKKTSKLEKSRLIQMTIDLGGRKVKKCPVCEMEYVASSDEDNKMHQQYHSLNTAGFDIPAKLLQNARTVTKQEQNRPSQSLHNLPDRVIKISRSDPAPLRRIASRVLEVAEKELGAVRTTDAELWSKYISADEEPPSPMTMDSSGTVQRNFKVRNSSLYMVYLYLRNRRCVGLCLVKHIHNGRLVLPSASGIDSTLIEPSYNLFPARLGISRIWVSRLFRRDGIAQCLLEAARSSAANGAPTLKNHVAFSQPTAAGMALARIWFGRDHGWLVFDDETCMIQEHRSGGNPEEDIDLRHHEVPLARSRKGR